MSNKWYLKDGGNLDGIVLSTRIRLARNLAGTPFPNRITPEGQREINHKVRDALINGNSAVSSDFTYFELDKLSAARRGAMLERHIISPELAAAQGVKALLLSSDESVSIMLGEEDHIRIQVLSQGEDLQDAFSLAQKLDILLDSELHFAFDERLGYLTECPTNLGTGLRASLMLHLPAIERLGAVERLAASVAKIGLTIRGTFGEGSGITGSLYQLSNQVTLGISEESAIENLKAIAGQIIAQEQSLREKADRLELEDTVFRSLGILRNARLLNSEEMTEALSNLRMGVSQKILRVPVSLINKLLYEGGSASLRTENETLENPRERDKRRAELARTLFAQV
ncbi:MAG: protein arginine kinase [Oscillospiraceae bacterium]|jgi:protein arginine kinase|nr:protein arginine kinase [Oscillospiraceae bacterium]